MQAFKNFVVPTSADGVSGALAHCDGLGIRFTAHVTRVSGEMIYVDQPVNMIEVDEGFGFRLIFGQGWPVQAVQMVFSLETPTALAEISGERYPGVAWNPAVNGRPLPLVVAEWLAYLVS